MSHHYYEYGGDFQQQQQPLQYVSPHMLMNGGEDLQSSSATIRPAEAGPRISVKDALPFSPFSSILPFSPEILPFPTPPTSTKVQLLVSEDEQQRAKLIVSSLNKEASNSQHTSVKLGNTLKALQQLLQPDKLSEFTFRQPPSLSQRPQTPSTLSVNGANTSLIPELSPLARLVMEKTDIAFRYPTPESPLGNVKKAARPTQSSYPTQEAAPLQQQPTLEIQKPLLSSGQNNTQVRKLIPQVIIPRPATSQGSVDKVAKVANQQPANGIHIAATISQNQQSHTTNQALTVGNIAYPQVVITPLAPGKNSDYAVYGDDESAARKRKRDDGDVFVDFSIDQKQKANLALQQLEDISKEYLDAADHFEPDRDDGVDFFVPGFTAPNEQPILTRSAQERLEKAITNVISCSYFSLAAIDTVTRLQKLCESTVNAVETLNITLDDNPSDVDVEEWAQRLEIAEGGMQAARILLRITNAGREEKQLYSEDLLASILRSMSHIMDATIIPVVECRSSGHQAELFKTFAQHRKALTKLIQLFSKVLRAFGDLAARVEIADSAITKAEYLSSRLIYVENAYIEKDACLGVQRFENLRRVAMDALAKIFGRYPDQRTYIFDEILVSLEKLPVTRQSARQYKIIDGKAIQLVSALLMRLVQTSATVMDRTSSSHRREKDERNGDKGGDSDDASDEDDASDYSTDGHKTDRKPARANKSEPGDDALKALKSVSEPLTTASFTAAGYVVQFLLQRALKSTKTGDEPYRNLLDIFTEDFLNVLGTPDWPAAEILLRVLQMSCMKIASDDKQPVPAKNTALDLMGLMGSGISELKVRARNLANGTREDHLPVYQKLARLVDDALRYSLDQDDAVSLAGPFSAAVEYLQSLGVNDAQWQTARGYLAAQWAKACLDLPSHEQGSELEAGLVYTIEAWIKEPESVAKLGDWEGISAHHGRLAAALVALQSQFCKMQPHIFTTILSFMTSQQPTLRNRSLKSALQLVEKEPDIVDRNPYALNQVIRCLDDTSSLVRDSALSFLARLLVLKPALQKLAYLRIVQAASDDAPSVRKRAIKILKDLYQRTDDKDMKASIAAGLMQRVNDDEDAIVELAKQTFAEIWMQHVHPEPNNDSAVTKLRVKQQAMLIVRTAQKNGEGSAALERLLKYLLSEEAPNYKDNRKSCKGIVAAIFDAILDNDKSGDKLSQETLASVMNVFAVVNPKLFDKDQVVLLKTYIKNLETTGNLRIFRSVVSIFRHVFPALSKQLGEEFLTDVQKALMANLKRLPKSELPETAACLWIVVDILNTHFKLINLMTSILKPLDENTAKNLNTSEHEKARIQVRRYLELAGPFGRACNFDEHTESFRTARPEWKGSSVSGLIIDFVAPYTHQKHPKNIRQVALESVGMICQAWPQNFLRADVCKAFELVFINDDVELQAIVMHAFRDFLAGEEKRSETGADIKVGEGAIHGRERLTKTYVPTDNDGATTTIAQRFLPHIVRIALKANDDSALTATRIIASINRQGLVHPKECGPPLVALETSPNHVVANIALEEHQRLHHKHETMFEKEYMRAVHQSYEYQRDVFNAPRGITLQPPKPKLSFLFDVLKSGNNKIRKRFLVNLCNKMDFDLGSLHAGEDSAVPDTVLYARYVAENIALLDYSRIDEILAVVTELEKLVTAGTGTTIAHAIDLDVFKVRLPDNASQQQNHAVENDSTANHDAPPPMVLSAEGMVSPTRLRKLAAAAMIMMLAWETRTYLRQLWGLQKQGKSVTKLPAKDINKAPSKQPFVQPDKYLDKVSNIMTALSSSAAQMDLCRSFTELMSIDHEVQIGEDEDGEADFDEPANGDDGGSDADKGTPVKGKKRKGSGSVAGTPTAKRYKKISMGRPGIKRAGSSMRRSRAGSSASGDETGDYF